MNEHDPHLMFRLGYGHGRRHCHILWIQQPAHGPATRVWIELCGRQSGAQRLGNFRL
jgi:hypothetical protein